MKLCLALLVIAALVVAVIVMCICMIGCTDVPYSVFKANDTDTPSNENSWTHGAGDVCYWDGFDYWCPEGGEVVVEVEVDDDKILPEPEIVYVAVPIYIEVEIEGETKYVEVPGETRTVEVVKEVEVEVEKIVEVVKEVEVEVEKIVEVVKIVEKEVEVEVIKEVEVEVEVIKEVEKIIEIPIEKIVYRDVPGTTLRVPFTGKIPIPDCGHGDNCMAVIENGVFVMLEYDSPEPLVVVCNREVGGLPGSGWAITVYYPTEQLGQEAIAAYHPGFAIDTSEGIPIFENWSSGGDDPVCAHYWLSTDATSIEVAVSARFNNKLYTYKGKWQ